jgi:transposase
MPTSYRPYEPDQVMLLPAAPQDWLPAGHLAHFISDTVDALDLKAFYARYEGGGSRNQPFHPAMMVKVLVYAYATGVFSSRKIERGCTRTWRFGCWRQATSRATARSATSAPFI